MELSEVRHMDWKKTSSEISDLLAGEIAPFNSQKKIMFGCPAYFYGGNMFAGVFGDDIFIRLSESDRKTAIEEYDEITIFEPVAGRPMKEYVVIPEAIYNDSAILQQWLAKSFAYVSSLKPKSAGAKK
jgi:TfoX/Sxy family transcriptional regulator of competence genes